LPQPPLKRVTCFISKHYQHETKQLGRNNFLHPFFIIKEGDAMAWRLHDGPIHPFNAVALGFIFKQLRFARAG
jgi:hypothetical protein